MKQQIRINQQKKKEEESNKLKFFGIQPNNPSLETQGLNYTKQLEDIIKGVKQKGKIMKNIPKILTSKQQKVLQLERKRQQFFFNVSKVYQKQKEKEKKIQKYKPKSLSLNKVQPKKQVERMACQQKRNVKIKHPFQIPLNISFLKNMEIKKRINSQDFLKTKIPHLLQLYDIKDQKDKSQSYQNNQLYKKFLYQQDIVRKITNKYKFSALDIQIPKLIQRNLNKKNYLSKQLENKFEQRMNQIIIHKKQDIKSDIPKAIFHLNTKVRIQKQEQDKIEQNYKRKTLRQIQQCISPLLKRKENYNINSRQLSLRQSRVGFKLIKER